MDSKKIQCLLVEDNLQDILLIDHMLREGMGDEVVIHKADTFAKGLDILKNQKADVIIIDLYLPDSAGVETYYQISIQHADIPIIVLTGDSDHELAVRVMQAGAQDYFVKGQVRGEALVRSIRFAIERKHAGQQFSVFRRFAEAAGYGFGISDIQGSIVYVNRSLCRILGETSPDSAVGKNVIQYYPDNKKDELKNRIIPIVLEKGQWVGTIEILGADLKIRQTIQNIIVVKDENNNPTHLGNVLIDITESKKHEETLRKLSMAVEQSPASVIITDHNGTIEYVNPKFIEVTGYSFDDVVGKNPRILKSGYTTDEQYKRLWKTIAAGEEWRGEFYNKKKNGELFWEYASISPIKDAQGIITHFIASKEDVTKRKEFEKRLVHQANFDSLTDLPNRILAFDRVSQAMSRAKRERQSVAVMFIDLDQFKKVNDTLGHSIGDELLIKAAHRLIASVRQSDTVARLGGDEFLVILPDLDAMTHSTVVAQKILESFSEAFVLGNNEVFVTASIGISIYPNDGTDPHVLLRNADAAMYKAKEDSRNTFRFFTQEMNEKAIERMAMEAHLRHVLERGELFLEYQPILNQKGFVTGAEALLRWKSYEFGVVYPQQFIPLAEETGFIKPIGAWVLGVACKQMKIWQSQFEMPLRITVNVSARQFKGGDFIDTISWALHESRLAPETLELEITEGLLMDIDPQTTKIIEDINAMGVRLSIDDFGTGYSSLIYLNKFPFQTLKIDRNFVAELNKNSKNTAVCSAIIAMAHSLGLMVISEGVETEEQLKVLQRYKCDWFQGYLFSKAVAPEAFYEYTENNLHLRK